MMVENLRDTYLRWHAWKDAQARGSEEDASSSDFSIGWPHDVAEDAAPKSPRDADA